MKTLYGSGAIIIAASVALIHTSCIREGLEQCPAPIYEYDIYVVGNGISPAESGTPLIWKNGEPEVLESKPYRQGVEFRNSTVQGVYVYGQDVYATGDDNGDDGNLKIWKNGLKTTDILPAGQNGTGQSISVHEGNVYIVANEGVILEDDLIKLWKNGTSTTLSDAGNYADTRSSLAVYDGSTYVVGNVNDGSDNLVPRLWQDTQAVPGVGGEVNTRFEDVFVHDGNVYVAGTVGSGSASRATLWVNGHPETLSEGWSEATCVFVGNGKIYVAGMTYDSAFEFHPVVWTDSEPALLPDEGRPCSIRDIFVLDGSVYAVGEFDIFPSEFFPALWTNGELTKLPLLICPVGYATGVFVVRR